MDLPLSTPAPVTCTQLIAECLWNIQSPPVTLQRYPCLGEICDLYFSHDGYYSQQCALFGHHEFFASVKTHREVADIAKLLRQPLSRPQVLSRIQECLGKDKNGPYQSPAMHAMSINLVVRLMLMIKVGSVAHECIGRTQLEWKSGTLQEFVHGHFSTSNHMNHDRLRLEKPFNALNLHRIAGVRIKWTDNLAEHLQMMCDDEMVAVFRHPSFLKAQRYK